MTAIRKHMGDFIAILVLVAIAVGVGAYILSQQRLRFPFVEDRPLRLNAELATAQAVTPGQGQTVRVAGVRIGDIAKVELKNGRAVVAMDIDHEYRDLVHTNATALLRPKTGLKDMFIEVEPGTDQAPVAKEGWTLPIQNTLPDVNPDEILGVLDADTRDYLKLLINGAGRGLDGRGSDFREVFRRFEPTHRDLARVSSAVATRRDNLRRLINSLNRLTRELATKRNDLSQLVDTAATTFRAFASEEANISRSLRLFPPALRQTTTTLTKVERFARVLGPTADRLRPVARSLDRANRAVRPFALEVAPILRTRIRPFVRDARPLVRDLRPAAQDLARATPDLTSSFVVLNHLFNMLGHNPNGREGPENRARQEGFLFFIAWLGHQGRLVYSTEDANGPFRPVFLGGTCQTINATAGNRPELIGLLNLTNFLPGGGICP